MADEIFRQQRKKISAEDLNETFTPVTGENPLEKVQEMQRSMLRETGKDFDSVPGANFSSPKFDQPLDAPFQMSGAIPPELRDMMQRGRNPAPIQSNQPTQRFSSPPQTMSKKPGSIELESLLEQLSVADFSQWEEIELPSKGKFYTNIPRTLHIKAMTGEEEQILATPRFVKKGKSIDMLFSRCIKEKINTEELLSIDRTYLIIYLRGISHTPEYDAEITCPSCASKFNTTINLNSLEVNGCPDDYGTESLSGVLPKTGWSFRYRLATGVDEATIRRHTETMMKEYGEDREDDALLFRTATLLESVEGVTDRNELVLLIKKLPVKDVAHLRHTIANPPFGVNTEIGMNCPACLSDFEIDLPVDVYFFFPKKKTE